VVTASTVQKVRDFIANQLWSEEPLKPAILGWLRSLVQLGVVIGEGFVKDHLLLRAHSLTFLTFLSMIPLLALAVTLVDLVGGGEEVVEKILDQFAGAVPANFKAQLLERVQGFQFAALGTVGGATLLATTILGVGTVETSLNAVWGVTEQRSWARRVPDYLAVIVIAPLLLGVAIPLRATIESESLVQEALKLPGLSFVYATGLEYAPFLLFVVAFSFLYWFLPNTKVELRYALIGGFVGALLFSIVQWAYVRFSIGAARYDAILGSMAAIALFLIWVYISWAIVLLGAEVAYAVQTLRLYRLEVQGAPAGAAAREFIGLAIAVQCARAFQRHAEPWTPQRLSDGLHVPFRTVQAILDELCTAGILAPCGGENVGAFQLGQPMEQTRVSDVLLALRGPRETAMSDPEVTQEVAAVLREVDQAAAVPAERRNLRDMVAEIPDPAP
jgi:membrane protein